jgi:hypothetical protein
MSIRINTRIKYLWLIKKCSKYSDHYERVFNIIVELRRINYE